MSARNFNRLTATLLVVSLPVVPLAAQSLPGLDNFTIEQRRPAPTPTPTPTAVPSATPTPAPTRTPAPVATRVEPSRGTPTALPSPRISPTTSPTPRPTPGRPTTTPTPAASHRAPAPVVPAATSPSPTQTPTVAATPASVAPATDVSRPWWWLPAGLLAAALAGGFAVYGWTVGRNRRREADREIRIAVAPPAAAAPRPEPQDATAGSAVDAPVATPAAARAPGGLITTSLRPEVVFDLQPVRAGVDTLRATLDYVLRVSNAGRAPASDVAVESWLFAAGTDPRAELDEILAQPIGELQLPPFDLPPSAAADLTGQAVASRDVLATITAGERKMFVPMLAVRAHFGDRRGQIATVSAAFMVGVERADQERLAPLALDRGARIYEGLAARRLES